MSEELEGADSARAEPQSACVAADPAPVADDNLIFSKCAWRLIPFMGLLYLVSFIDRTNAGLAAHTMNKDLGFSPTVFGFGAGIFFIGYAVFQVPANVILEKMGARRWVFYIMAAWGLLAASNALVQNPISFYVVRFLLGVAEAGFFPGMLLYLNYWFPRGYLARFISYFMIALPLSFIIGGPLSSLILGMGGMAGLHGWQWLFLLEGLPAFALSFAVLRFLPDGPARAHWLTCGEKNAIAARLAAEEPSGRPDLWHALRDLRLLALGFGTVAIYAAAFGIYLWLPQIVEAMGFSGPATGFVVALCYLAGIPAMVLVGRSSSRRGERIWHAALPLLLSASSLAIASLTQSNALVLAALALALIGNFAGVGPIYSLPSSFLRGTAAAGGIGLIGTFGNVGAFLGPTFTGLLLQGSGNYRSGFAMDAIGYALGGLIVIAVGRALAPRLVAPEPVTEIGHA
ncbi:MAG TPA: MFS transporter [Rhizomicrobium sp.]|nr:MFS transporter [Rhizomicrobium sp.]